MKKSLLIIALLGFISQAVLAQSDLSYSFQVNKSGSLDDTYGICILKTSGGTCLLLEATWKVNYTLTTNYRLNDHVRLQTGLGYNVLSQDVLNQEFGEDIYKLKFISIPTKAHYFINQGKARFYFGGGLRTDIRVNDKIPYNAETGVYDNTSTVNISAEALIGLEVQLTPQLGFGVEPTYSRGITNYHRDNPYYDSALNQGMIATKPQRFGFTFVVTYGL